MCSRWQWASLAHRISLLFFRCSTWPRASLARCHFFVFVVDDGEPGGLLSFFSFFLRCKRQRRVRQARCHLLYMSKKTIVKKKQIKKKVDVHLFATNALVSFWRSIFFNTTSTTFSTTLLLQHYFNTPVQHCLLQQHFNIVFVALLSATLLLFLSDEEV